MHDDTWLDKLIGCVIIIFLTAVIYGCSVAVFQEDNSMTDTEIHKFTKGQKLHLDDIYHIQGIGGVDWWKHIDGETDDFIIITRTIEITIISKYRKPNP